MVLSKVRQRIQNQCDWGVGNSAQIHYSQDLTLRNQSLSRWKNHELPFSTDCSGALTDIFHAAGAPDPSGLGYNAIGNTGTLYSNSEHILMSHLEPGDFIICFKGAESEHVYIVRRKLANGDYQIFTHGDESCPKYENLSQVSSYWNSVGHMTGCRTLPLQDEYRWTIFANGDVVTHTDHPVLWATRHPRAFRRFERLGFRRNIV
jgi:hypothetical protein